MSSHLIKCMSTKDYQNFLKRKSILVQIVNNYFGRSKIGTREVVGYGANGSYNYYDRPDTPCSAIRFKEDTPEIKALKEKEKGDWKNLTLEEKKNLYRASFCRTYSEMTAHTGHWKIHVAGFLWVLVLTWWMFYFSKVYLMPPLPESCSPEKKKELLQYYLDRKVEIIDGISSKWDYENNRWK